MTDSLLHALVTYGVPTLFLTALLSCLAVPIPMAIVMLSAGALAALGDMSFFFVWSVTVIGAILGDQFGYHLGAQFRDRLHAFFYTTENRAKLWERADDHLQRWGTVGVFLSRWLVSPIGPYVNVVAGATGLNWYVFTTAAVIGEIVWVSIYVGLGFVFASNLERATSLAQDTLSSIGAFMIATAISYVVLTFAKRRRATLS